MESKQNRAAGEPIAIVGIGCHLPGNISKVEELIRALVEGRDCVTEVPPERWPVDVFYDPDTLTPGKTYVRHGGFVNDIDRFDAAFFGIVDAEASRMDPQQRMALQTVWHALENAGQSAEELMRSKTGVFLAMMNTNSYSQLKGAIEGGDGITGYDAMGDAMSITAGRISHFLGLEGPCVSLDTACSGSMVATHLACRSILLGECDAAIVVGVNALLHPGIHIAFSKLGLMSRKGRCAAFDEAADGYIRSEGCIAVLLRRQSLALERNDRIVASIVATAINQDGRTPAITAPSTASQEKVIRAALRRVGLHPNEIGYVEAHGTGTPVGDPIEMRGLVKVFGDERSEPLFVGSAKSNFGHLEAGAGLLGLVKAALSLDQEQIFPSLHFQRLNPAINLDGVPLRVPTQAIPWPRTARRRMAGVNSFGYSGTNAHAVLQEAEPSTNGSAPASGRPRELLVLSAKNSVSLQELVDRWIDFLAATPPASLGDIAFTAATGRTHFRHRLAVIAASKSELVGKLKSWREDRAETGVAAGRTKIGRKVKAAFVFTGTVTQFPRVSRALYETETSFKSAIDAVAACLATYLNVPLQEILFGPSSADLLSDERHAAAALFAIEYALASLLRECGVAPDCVTGKDAGALAAVCFAGACDLETAVAQLFSQPRSLEISTAKVPVMPSVNAVIEAGCTLLIEVGPQAIADSEMPPGVDASKLQRIATLRPDGDLSTHLYTALAELYVAGLPLHFKGLFSPAHHRVSLPLYAFRAARHWVEGTVPLDGKNDVQQALQSPDAGPQPLDEVETSALPHPTVEDDSPQAAGVYEIEWLPKTLPEERQRGETSSQWLIVADGAATSMSQAIREVLESRGDACVVASQDQLEPTELGNLMRAQFGGQAPDGVIYLSSLNVSPPASVEVAVEQPCVAVLHLVQALLQTGWINAPRLWIVTRNAQVVANQPVPVDLTQSPLWGLGKVISIEHPELRSTKVDLSPAAAADEVQALVREFTADDREDQVAQRNGVRYVARLVRREDQVTEKDAPLDRPFRVEITTPGVLDHLARRAIGREEPGPDQVQIQVSATGLNFNDVLKAMGMYPGMADGQIPLGSECAGTVAAVGAGVEGFAIGDPVVAIAPSSFGTFVTAPAPLVWRKPSQLSFEEAATIPVAFVTSVYALRHLAQLTEGDRVLIHSASGGVGLAAVQVAQLAGAEIFATAGSPEKRAYLEKLGIRHVMDSRSLAFADEVMSHTAGRGVDVVLNSLAGEAMLKSLSVLAPFGRFLEIGKRDIYENRDVGLAPFQKQLAYFSIDLERLFAERPRVAVKVFREVMQDFESGVFKPLHLQVFPITQVVDAFREMAQARHIGKIVVSAAPQNALGAPSSHVSIRSDGTYLITGALSGVDDGRGLAVAERFVARGARHLVLTGSAPSAAAQTALDAMKQAGAQVTVMPVDLSDREQLSKALMELDRTMPPLSGVIHAEDIQDDGVLLRLAAQQFTSVLTSKIGGAWNLHELNRDRKLDFFILFSSAASVMGSPGQGSYAAANAFLDSLAQYRRANGMPALSINWGPWSEGNDRPAKFGMMSVTPDQGLDMLERFLNERTPQIGFMRLRAQAWQGLYPKAAWPFIEKLPLAKRALAASPLQESALRKMLMTLPTPLHRRAFIESHLLEELARALRVPESQLDKNQPLQTSGLDSISAVELRNRWQEELGMVLPVTLIWDYPTITALATHLASRLEGTTEQSKATAAAATVAVVSERTAVVSEVKKLSEAEAEALLLEKLGNIEARRPQ